MLNNPHKAAADSLIELYPALTGAIQAGLLIAAGGGVQPAGALAWRASSNGHCYNVEVRGNNAWYCQCEQGSKFGPTAAEFYGYRAPHFCKHMAAVAICLSSNDYPPKPGNLFDVISRVIEAGLCDNLQGGDSLEVYKKNGNGLRIICRKQDRMLVLRYGRGSLSKAIGEFVRDVTQAGQNNIIPSRAVLLPEARRNYDEWRKQ